MKRQPEQVYLRTFLEAYAANPHRTEANLPGGGSLFASCTRAAERQDAPSQRLISEVAAEMQELGATDEDLDR